MESQRELSKARRRRDIQRAALLLFGEHGYDGATINDVAALAHVAPRTVLSYFPTKFELAMSASRDIAAGLLATFQANHSSGFTSVIETWLDAGAEIDAEFAALAGAMFTANPGLRALAGAELTKDSWVALAAVATEMGVPAEHPMVPFALSAAAGVLTEYLMQPTRSGETREIDRDDLLRYLQAVISAASPMT